MTRQTLAADVLDGLLSAWRADSTLSGYGTRLRIFDGPPLDDRAAEIELWVGATGTASDEEVIVGEQTAVTMRQTDDRDEVLSITNTVWVAAGNTDMATARRTAIDVFNAAMTAVRGSDLGIADVFDTAECVGYRLRQGQFTTGAGVVLTFTVQIMGQI